jgi:sRNA-binding regulator protein Hfq
MLLVQYGTAELIYKYAISIHFLFQTVKYSEGKSPLNYHL